MGVTTALGWESDFWKMVEEGGNGANIEFVMKIRDFIHKVREEAKAQGAEEERERIFKLADGLWLEPNNLRGQIEDFEKLLINLTPHKEEESTVNSTVNSQSDLISRSELIEWAKGQRDKSENLFHRKLKKFGDVGHVEVARLVGQIIVLDSVISKLEEEKV